MTKIEELYQDILFRIEYEKRALAEDNPKSTCAAHHRGQIYAYEYLRDELAKELYPATIARITAKVAARMEN